MFIGAGENQNKKNGGVLCLLFSMEKARDCECHLESTWKKATGT